MEQEMREGLDSETRTDLLDFARGRRLLFITTKNIDYIRNSQEIDILSSSAESVRLIYSTRKSYPGRIAEIYWKIFRFHMDEVDAVFVGFSPQLLLPWYGRLTKKPLVMDFFVSVYDTFVNDRQKFSPRSLVARLCHRLDEKTLGMADYVVCDTKADGKYFAEEFSPNFDKFHVLYLEADSRIYYPREQKKPLQYQDKFLVLYFGSMLPLQGIDVILDAIRLLNRRDDIHFEMIGPIPDKYERPYQDNVTYIDWLTQEELAEHIAWADLCLGGHFHGSIDKARRTIAGKTYIYRAMGRPVILGDNEANRELFSEEDGMSMLLPMGSPESLADGISVTADYYFATRGAYVVK